MGDVYRYIDAICDVYDDPKLKPILDNPDTPENERRTYCNFAVQKVAEKLGYVKFTGMIANKMVEHMQQSPDWFATTVADAQGYANGGCLVVAGQIDLPHGHVAIIRPGSPEWSGKWQKPCPRVMNIGATNFISHKLSNAFRDEPLIYVWKGIF